MRLRTMVAISALSVFALGSCGGDDVKASTSIKAKASEFKFEPNSWTVPVGQEFTIAFTNGGTVEHEWAVIKLGQDLAAEADFAEEKVLFEVEAIPAGQSTTQKFTVDKVGTYQVMCAIETHFNAGMKGKLTVK